MIQAAFICIFGAIIATFGGNSILNCYLSRFAGQLNDEHKKNQAIDAERGFPEGGKLIGQLERFLIFLFVMTYYPGGIGFLITAKSVFRFGELTDQKNRMEAEYITIGTLMSYSWGFAVSLIAKLLIDHVLATK